MGSSNVANCTNSEYFSFSESRLVEMACAVMEASSLMRGLLYSLWANSSRFMHVAKS